MNKSLVAILKRPRKTKEDLLEEAIAGFAEDFRFLANKFSDRVRFALTGLQDIGGNDGVNLGTRKIEIKSRREKT